MDDFSSTQDPEIGVAGMYGGSRKVAATLHFFQEEVEMDLDDMHVSCILPWSR